MVIEVDSAHETEINPRVFGFHELCNEAKKTEMASKVEKQVPYYKSVLSEFDDYVASYGFEMGDMVWGKVKSHPWWPGRIFNEAFVSPSVRNLKNTGHVLVAFYGDNSYGWFDPSELIPFEPHFTEKSQQTKSISFVKAIEEAMEETCKRSALGLTCKCLNPLNFRPGSSSGSNVKGCYFLVDVPGYEVQAVYSDKQIKKARDRFLCLKTLSFVKRRALSPLECDDSESVEFCQKKAAVFAFRRAVFEEFDETYDQAFRVKSAYALVKTQEPVTTRTPSRALLSGSLVTAETLGDTKSSEHAMKVKDSTEQGKYSQLVTKRREEFGRVQESSSEIQDINGHLLPRRTQYLQTPSGTVSKVSRYDDKGLAQESKVRMGEKGTLFPEHENLEAMTSLKQDETRTLFRSNKGSLQGKSAAGVGIKKVNVLKWSSGEMNYANGPKKKEPRSELNLGNPDKRKPLTFVQTWDKKSSQLDAAERHSNTLTVSNSKHDVMQLLSGLQALSLDPFFGSSDRSSVKAVKQFFLRFRSHVYQNSSLAKSAKTLSSLANETPKTGEKRFSSDHQQDISSTKKLKKTIEYIRPMASDKKTNQEAKKNSNLAPLSTVRDRGGPGPVPINAKAPSAKVIEPTMLVMKFPYGTSLPSTALLKARFGRFGPLDQSASRVIWKSSICRVVFLYKFDAQTALRYASGSNSLFGNVNVTYFLRDAKAEPKKAKTDEPMVEPLSQRLEQATLVHKPNIQLKSCLKKTGSNGNGNRGTARVKFMFGGKETETRFRVSGIINASSSSIAMEFVSKNTQNIVPSTLPPIQNTLSSQNSKRNVNSDQVDQVEPPLDQSECQVDISEEMVKLLVRCNDVVSNVTGLLGYVPYHSL